MNDIFRMQAIMTFGDFISGPIAAVRQSFRAAGKDADSLSGKITGIAKKAAPFAIAFGLIAGAMTGTAMATTETSKALGEMASVGVEDMAAMTRAAQEFSNQWSGTTKADFISSAYDIKSAISSLSDQGVADFTRLAALTGKATKATTATMTSLFATGYGIYKSQYDALSDLQFGELFSAGIAASVKNFKTTGDQMAAAIENIGSTATSSNIALEEQLAVLGLLQQTMSGSEAGTRYRQFVLQAANAGNELGLNFTDAAGRLKSMPEILDILRASYGDVLDEMEKRQIAKAFGSQEALMVVDNMWNRLDNLRGGIGEVSAAMDQGTGFTLEMARVMNEDLGANVQTMKQRFGNLVEIIGAMFVPVINTAVQFLSWLALGFQKVAEAIGSNPVLKWVVQMTAVTGLVASLIGLFGALSAVMPIVITMAGGYASAMWSAAVASLSVMWPIYAVIGVLGLLMLAYKTNFLGIGETLRSWFGTVRLVIDGVRAVFANLRGDTYTITGDLAESLKAGGLAGIVDVLAGALYRLWMVFRGIGDAFIFAARIAGTVLSPIWNMMASSIAMLVSGLGNLWSVLMTLTSPLIQLIGLINPNAWRILGAVIGSAVVVPIMAFLALLTPVAAAIGVVVGAVWIAANAFQGWMSLINLVVEAVFSGFGKLANFEWRAVFGLMSGGIRSMIDYLGSFSLFDAGRSLWQSFVNGIKSMIMAPVDIVKSGLQKVRDLLPFSNAKDGPLSTLSLSGSRLMSTVAEGVTAAAPGLRKAVGVALTGIMPLAAGADVAMPEPYTPESAIVELVAPVIEQAVPEIPGASNLTVPPPEITSATAIALAAPEFSQDIPAVPEIPSIQIGGAEITIDAPVIDQAIPEIMNTPVVSVPEPVIEAVETITAPAARIEAALPELLSPAGAVEMAAPDIVQDNPAAPEIPAVEVAASEVTVAAPVIDQEMPDIMSAPEIVTPAPEIIPPVPEMAAPGTVEIAPPDIVQDNPAAPEIPAVEIAAAEVTVAAPVIDQEMPDIMSALAVSVPAPELTPADAVVVPHASVTASAPEVSMPEPVAIGAPEILQPENRDTPDFSVPQLTEPVNIETNRETTVEKTHTEKVSESGSRRYTIHIQNLHLPKVTDARSFIDELSDYVDGHDGGNG